MVTQRLPLLHYQGRPWVEIRELRGHDEEWLSGTDLTSALGLLDRLLTGVAGSSLAPPQAEELTFLDRDRILLSIYSQVYGPRILATSLCAGCGSVFDLDFTLDFLIRELNSLGEQQAFKLDSQGVFSLDNGIRFRLPIGRDELAVGEMVLEEAADSLWKRCLVQGEAEGAVAAVQQALENLLLPPDLELAGLCPECHEKQRVRFDIQRYLLTALLQDQRGLPREIHLLARSYGWSYQEILSLPRSRRKQLVALILDEQEELR